MAVHESANRFAVDGVVEVWPGPDHPMMPGELTVIDYEASERSAPDPFAFMYPDVVGRVVSRSSRVGRQEAFGQSP